MRSPSVERMPDVTRTRVDPPFELELAVFGHGWISLAPHRWESGRWHTTLQTPDGVVDLVVRQARSSLSIEIHADFLVESDTRRFIRRSVRHMLRLDEDLKEFWRMCEQVPRLRWVARRGGGRLMRSPTVFEDGDYEPNNDRELIGDFIALSKKVQKTIESLDSNNGLLRKQVIELTNAPRNKQREVQQSIEKTIKDDRAR